MTTPPPNPDIEPAPIFAETGMDETGLGETGMDEDGYEPTDETAEEESGRRKSHLIRATIAGAIMAVIGAAGWVYVVVETGRRYALIALVIGLLVGYTVRLVGRNGTRVAGLIAGVLALISAMLGQFFEGYGLLTKDSPIGFFDTFDIIPLDQGFKIFRTSLKTLTYVMFALAAVTGFLLGVDPKARAAAAPVDDWEIGEGDEYGEGEAFDEDADLGDDAESGDADPFAPDGDGGGKAN